MIFDISLEGLDWPSELVQPNQQAHFFVKPLFNVIAGGFSSMDVLVVRSSKGEQAPECMLNVNKIPHLLYQREHSFRISPDSVRSTSSV